MGHRIFLMVHKMTMVVHVFRKNKINATKMVLIDVFNYNKEFPQYIVDDKI
jgi:hypothetical protein